MRKKQHLVKYDPKTGHFSKEVIAPAKHVKPWAEIGISRMSWYRHGHHKKYNQKIVVRADYPSGRYHCVRVGGRAYRAHRLAWLYSYGNWPSLIDHINGDGHDNRLINLREATKAQNRINYRKENISNLTGVRGVSLIRQGSRKYYIAVIRSGGKVVFQKCCRNLIEATKSIVAARKRLYGKFAPYHDAALCGIIVFFLMSSVTDASICLTKHQARELWPTRHIWWYRDRQTDDRCWSNRRGGPPRGLKLEPEPKKEKKIKGDPVFNQIRAEDETSVELNAVTWQMRRPFDEARPIHPPLNIAVPDDPDVWPDLSEFERRFVGVHP